MAGVNKLPSGSWRGWYKDYEGHRAFFTLSPTATKQEVRATAQALEVQHAQIRLGVRPRPDHPRPPDRGRHLEHARLL